MGNYLLQTFFFYRHLLINNFFHCLIKLLNNDVQGAEGTQHKKRKKRVVLGSLSKKI